MKSSKLHRVLAVVLGVAMLVSVLTLTGCQKSETDVQKGGKSEDVTVQSLMDAAQKKVSESKAMQFDMNVDMDFGMTVFGESQNMSMQMRMKSEYEDKISHMFGTMTSSTPDGQSEQEQADTYVVEEDGKYVKYTKEGDVWYKSVVDEKTQNALAAMISSLDYSKLKVEVENDGYKVFGEMSVAEAMKIAGQTLGDMADSGDLTEDDIKKLDKVSVEYHFNKASELVSAQVDMGKMMESMFRVMVEKQMGAMSGTEEGTESTESVDMSTMFSFKVDKCLVKIENVAYDSSTHVVLPAEAAEAVEATDSIDYHFDNDDAEENMPAVEDTEPETSEEP